MRLLHGECLLARHLRCSRSRATTAAAAAKEYRVMSMSVGTASNALSYLQSLLAQGTAGAGTAAATDPLSSLLGSTSGAADVAASAPAPTGASASASFDPGTLAALLSLQDQSANAAQGPSSLFSKIDANGDGQISQTEWDTALGNAGVDQSSANALFTKLDTNGDGSISQSELGQARHGGGHHHMHASGGSSGSDSSGADALLSGTDASGTTTQTTANGDGSSTTTITYADGSTVEMTTAATSPNDSGSNGSGTGAGNPNGANLIERLIQMQAQLLNQAASTISAMA
jgi:hypothetical protein